MCSVSTEAAPARKELIRLDRNGVVWHRMPGRTLREPSAAEA